MRGRASRSAEVALLATLDWGNVDAVTVRPGMVRSGPT
jgi:hypothetical protein